MSHPQLQNPETEDLKHGKEAAAQADPAPKPPAKRAPKIEDPSVKETAVGKAAAEAREAAAPRQVTRQWLEKQVAERLPHLGIHESADGKRKGYYHVKRGADQSFRPVGSTWRSVAEALQIIPASD